MRVLVDCDPPLLKEVVELALSRIEGVEVTDDAESGHQATVTSRATTGGAGDDARTVVVDGNAGLPSLLAQVTAWISQSDAGDFPLFEVAGSRDDTAVELARGQPSTPIRTHTPNPKSPEDPEHIKRQAKEATTR